MKGWKLLLAVVVMGLLLMPIMENVFGTSVKRADLEVGGLHKASSAYYAPLSSGGSACAKFEAYVTNHGPSAVPYCRVYWYIDGERVASQIGPALNVDETKKVVSPSICTTPGRHEVRVEVQPPIGYVDPNPSNNIDEGYFWILS
ncbi:MAG TPA: hypothetical protein ENL42_04140 [Thermoplasmatales archaeon]|nr:hypothetical protein [Thermoplasmatales archaeon]